MGINLKTLLVPSKATTCDYPGMPDFTIDVSFLSRESLQKMRKKATKTTFKNRAPIEELDDDLFLELYVQATVKGWAGLKLKYLEQLAPVELGVEDPESEMEYTEDNALALMKSSVNFDNYISEQSTDLANFTVSRSETAVTE
jgi:hypothetical protein